MTPCVYREGLARSSSVGGVSSCCRYHHPLCQSATRLSTVGCYVHQPCPADDGSVLMMGDAGRRQSVASSASSVTDCSGSRHAPSCQCDDPPPEDIDETARAPIGSSVAPAPGSSRVCVVQGLLRTSDDVRNSYIYDRVFL